MPELAAVASPIDVALSVNELPRFVEALAVEQDDDFEVGGRLDIEAEDSQKVRIRGQITANVLTQCQRCLNGLPLELMIPVDWRLPEDIQGGAAESASDIEIRLLDWVEDELQLAIPLFAKHDDENCGGELAKSYAETSEDRVPETITPFDGLKDLLSKK